jgi:glycosyltransferase involved in cell wall biosynthesis
MKIAHLSAHYRPIIGGQEVYISNLIEVCRKAGHESIVYQLDRGQKASDAVCLPRLPYLARFIPGIDRKWLNYMVSALKPKGLFGADAIIAHYAFHAPPLERVRNKTIILSHGVEWRVNDQTPYDIACEANAKRCLDRYLHVVNDTHYLRHLGMDVPAATGFFQEVAPRIWFIPNCVDTNHFVPGPRLPEYEGRNMILVPRQMVEQRGIHIAIAAFALIAKEHPDLEMCLLGKRHKGAASYLAHLDRLIADADLKSRIHFRDPVPNKDMPSWYNSAKAVLVPTLEKEGTSLSAIESMSCGIATISTNVAGLTDLPTVQCDAEPESMAAALRSTLADPTPIGLIQQAAVQKIFNMTNWSEGWMKAISAVAN